MVAACELDPATVLRGRELLFGTTHYRRLFTGRPAKDYVALVWLGRCVGYSARSSRERKLGRWVVLNFVRGATRGMFATNERRECFLKTWVHRNQDWRLRALDRYIDQVFRAVTAFYRKNRGEGAERVDAVPFFNIQSMFEWLSDPILRSARIMPALRFLYRGTLREFL